jgi:hypothetical protein
MVIMICIAECNINLIGNKMFEDFLEVLCEAGITFDLTDSQKSIMSDTFNSYLRDAGIDERRDGYDDGYSEGYADGYDTGSSGFEN